MKIEHQSISYLEEWLYNHSSNVDQIYISLGAKYNQEYVQFGSQTHSHNDNTNSLYQMIPNFIRYPQTDKHNIVIVVDEFHNKELLEKNKRLLTNEIHFHCLEGLSILLVDHHILYKEIDKILNPLINFMETSKLAPEKLKIVNYIQFQRPNSLELKLEKELPTSIAHFLKTEFEGKYIANYYQWYGYMFYYYDYIYAYEEYHFSKLMHMMFIQINLLQKSIFSTHLNPLHYEQIDHLANFLKKQNQTLYDAWICFKKNNIHLKDDFNCLHSQDSDQKTS